MTDSIPPSNSSISVAAVLLIRFTVSCAASSSGYIIKSIPSSLKLTSESFERYSAFAMRAIVLFAPIFFASIAAVIFTSSDDVTATNKSASFVLASFKIPKEVAEPVIVNISTIESIRESRC